MLHTRLERDVLVENMSPWAAGICDRRLHSLRRRRNGECIYWRQRSRIDKPVPRAAGLVEDGPAREVGGTLEAAVGHRGRGRRASE